MTDRAGIPAASDLWHSHSPRTLSDSPPENPLGQRPVAPAMVFGLSCSADSLRVLSWSGPLIGLGLSVI